MEFYSVIWNRSWFLKNLNHCSWFLNILFYCTEWIILLYGIVVGFKTIVVGRNGFRNYFLNADFGTNGLVGLGVDYYFILFCSLSPRLKRTAWIFSAIVTKGIEHKHNPYGSRWTCKSIISLLCPTMAQSNSFPVPKDFLRLNAKKIRINKAIIYSTLFFPLLIIWVTK